VKEGRIITPAGLVDTSSIDDLLRTYVAQARMVNVFDELPIPFRAVATDMVTAKMVVLDQGDLATAMRASMAIPGAFSPVPMNGMVLSDGGMVRNIPVDVARSMCADVVIVVNLVEDPVLPEKLAQATQLLTRSMDVGIIANEAIQLESLGERDVLIDVPMGDITTADFERVPETIPLGEAAARAAAGRLAAYALPAAEYLAWREQTTTKLAPERRIADIRTEGLNWVNGLPGVAVDRPHRRRRRHRCHLQGREANGGARQAGESPIASRAKPTRRRSSGFRPRPPSARTISARASASMRTAGAT
jgi:NTE family protein